MGQLISSFQPGVAGEIGATGTSGSPAPTRNEAGSPRDPQGRGAGKEGAPPPRARMARGGLDLGRAGGGY